MKSNVRHLPETTLGKAGRDLFSKGKELTVVMFPYESYSAFPKAIHNLRKVLKVPFNLIVIEGNAPDSARRQLEECETRYGNITILYSPRYLSAGEVINLARPHIRTSFAFFMDNEICIKPETIERLLQNARDKKADIVFPKNSLIPRQFKTPQQNLIGFDAPGLRLSFLISSKGLTKLLKFDEQTNLYTVGMDLMLQIQAKELKTVTSLDVWLESFPEHSIKSSDREFYQHQWDLKRHRDGINHFEQKWSLEIKDGVYQRWFESKSQKAATRKNVAQTVLQHMFAGLQAGHERSIGPAFAGRAA